MEVYWIWRSQCSIWRTVWLYSSWASARFSQIPMWEGGFWWLCLPWHCSSHSFESSAATSHVWTTTSRGKEHWSVYHWNDQVFHMDWWSCTVCSQCALWLRYMYIERRCTTCSHWFINLQSIYIYWLSQLSAKRATKSLRQSATCFGHACKAVQFFIFYCS